MVYEEQGIGRYFFSSVSWDKPSKIRAIVTTLGKPLINELVPKLQFWNSFKGQKIGCSVE